MCHNKICTSPLCSIYHLLFVTLAPSKPSCTIGDVKLVGGTISSEGYVQVCINGVWSSVCAEGWDTRDAEVVCNQLQFPNSESMIIQ